MAGDNVSRIILGVDTSEPLAAIKQVQQEGKELAQSEIANVQKQTQELQKQKAQFDEIIAQKRQTKQLNAEIRRDELEAQREKQLSGVTGTGERAEQRRAQINKQINDDKRRVMDDERAHVARLEQAQRTGDQHFQQRQQQRTGGGMFGGMGAGALMGGAAGFLSGGGLAGLAGAGTSVALTAGGKLLGGAGGMLSGTPVIGGAMGGLMKGIGGVGEAVAPMAGMLVGAAFGQGARMAESRAQLSAATGGVDIPTLTRLGMDRAQVAERQKQLAHTGGTKGLAGQVGAISGLELGTGIGAGGLNQMAGMRQLGFTEDVQPMMKKFLNLAANSKLWGIDDKDFSALPRELGNMSQLMQTQANVMADPNSADAMMLRTQFASLSADAIGGLFSGARGTTLMMGMHQSLVNPANQFQQARGLQAILNANPDIGGGLVGFTRARSIMAQGMFGKGRLGGELEQLSQMGGSTEEKAAILVNRFEDLLPFFESEQGRTELEKMFEPEFIGKVKKVGSKEEMEKLMKAEGFKSLADLGATGGVSATQQLNSKILDFLQVNGEVWSEKVASSIQSIPQLLENIKAAITGGEPIDVDMQPDIADNKSQKTLLESKKSITKTGAVAK